MVIAEEVPLFGVAEDFGSSDDVAICIKIDEFCIDVKSNMMDVVLKVMI